MLAVRNTGCISKVTHCKTICEIQRYSYVLTLQNTPSTLAYGILSEQVWIQKNMDSVYLCRQKLDSAVLLCISHTGMVLQ